MPRPRPMNPGIMRPIGNRPMIRPRLGALGASAQASALESRVAATAAGAGATALATGTAVGSVAGPIGAAVGAVVGVVVGILTKTNNTASHIGSWDSQLVSALGALPTTAQGLGRQFAWNENSHGLVQMIEALLATGIYMSWDPSLISSYDVCAHWAMTFGLAVQNVATAVCKNPVGAKCTVNVVMTPGASVAPFNFVFTNPGIGVGPDAVAAKVIMSTSGLMYAMIKACGETTAHATSNATNATAQKVYSLMIDYWAAQVAPAAAVPSKPVPVVAPAVAAAATAANTAVAAGHNPVTAAVIATTPAPASAPVQTGTTSTGTPVVDPDDTAALISTLIAQGQSQTAAINAGLASLEANGINSQAPASQAALQTSAAQSTGMFGLSTTDLIFGAAALGMLFWFMSSNKGSAAT